MKKLLYSECIFLICVIRPRVNIFITPDDCPKIMVLETYITILGRDMSSADSAGGAGGVSVPSAAPAGGGGGGGRPSAGSAGGGGGAVYHSATPAGGAGGCFVEPVTNHIAHFCKLL